MFRYNPPGNWDDLAGRVATRGRFRDQWHDFILGEFKTNIQSLRSPRTQDGIADTPIPSPLFFTEAESPAAVPDGPVPWNGFPLSLERKFPNIQRAWAAADELRQRGVFDPATRNQIGTLPFRPQDEYCEWYAYKDEGGKVVKYAFTAEPPEYWSRLYSVDKEAVLELYKDLVSRDVQPNDLEFDRDLIIDGWGQVKARDYNPWNVWNTDRGVVHLTHPANTLGAEINLAAQATRQRKDANGQLISDVRRLVCCSGYGNPNRSSDPSIGHAANLAVRGGVSLTLSDPVGLYIAGFQSGQITGPDDEPLDHWLRVTRGSPGRGLRAELSPPPGSPFGLEKVKVRGVDLAFGGQVAQLITMALYVKTVNLGQPAGPVAPCLFRCCKARGSDPARANLSLASRAQSCADGNLEDAFPELHDTVVAGGLGRFLSRTTDVE